MPTSFQVQQFMNRDKKAKDWDRMKGYNIQLEQYLYEAISVCAQHDIAPPEALEPVATVLREKFINVIKGGWHD